MKGHGVNLKTVSLTAYAANVKIPPKTSIFKSNTITQVQRTTEAKRFELGIKSYIMGSL
jgi:hypothetical protein